MTTQTFFDIHGQHEHPKNPAICLYHTTDMQRLPHILQNGFKVDTIKKCEETLREVAEEEGLTEDEIYESLTICPSAPIQTRHYLDENLDINRDGIYFVKMEDDILEGEAVVKVPAEFISCQCYENDYDLENELYSMVYDMFSEHAPSPEEDDIYAKMDDVEASNRPLDTRENTYVTEVICPCDIPSKFIAIHDVHSNYKGPRGAIPRGSCAVDPVPKDHVIIE